LKKWHWVAIGSGLPAVFLWGGKRRSDPVRRLQLESGDIVVWGGPARFVYHGVERAAPADRAARINLTFRKVL
jgi:alkylated DNA repair protein (DNA oxidative demethylase)